MTDQEIDKWVEEHIKVPPKEELNEYTTVVYPKLIPAVIKWGKVVAHKFYKLGKSEIPINLTWQDIATIDSLLTEVSNSYAVGNFDYDGERENFYKKVLDEYNRLHQTKA